MKKTLKFLSSVLLISTLGLVNCHKYETGGSATNGYLIASYINGIIQSATTGNCAISVNGSGLWFGKVVETAITDGAAIVTQTANTFDKVDYEAVTGTTLTNTQWAQLPYNQKYDAFFKTGGVWTTATRNAALSFTRGKMNAVAGLGAISSTCDSQRGSSTFTALGSTAAPFGSMVTGWYAKLSAIEQAEVDNFYNISLNGNLKQSLLTSTFTNSTFKTTFPNIASTTAPTSGGTAIAGMAAAYTGTTFSVATATANLGAVLLDLSKAGSTWAFGVPSAKAACSTILSENATTINSSPFTANADLRTRIVAVNSLFTGAAQSSAAHIATLTPVLTFNNAALAGLSTASFNATCTAAAIPGVLSPIQCLAAAGTTTANVDAILTGMGAATTGGMMGVANGNALAVCITLDRIAKFAATTLTKDTLLGTMPTFPSNASSGVNSADNTVSTIAPTSGLITIADPTGGFTNASRVKAYNDLSNEGKAQYFLHSIVKSTGGRNFYTLGATNLRCPEPNFTSSANIFPLNIPPAGASAIASDAVDATVKAAATTTPAVCSFTAGSSTITCNALVQTYIGARVTCNDTSANCTAAGFPTSTTVTGITEFAASIVDPLGKTSITLATAPTAAFAGLNLLVHSRTTNGNPTLDNNNIWASYTHATIYKVFTSFIDNNVPSFAAPSYVLSVSTIPTVTSVSTASSLIGLRTIVGSGALACARIPRANCTMAGTTTASRAADLSSIRARIGILTNTANCAKTDTTTLTALTNTMGYEGNVLSSNASQSNFTGNKVLPDKAYPKFGSLVDLGFGMVMPVKEGVTRYPDFSANPTVDSTFAISGTDFSTEGFFTSMGTTGGSNIGYSVVESCEAVGLGTGPFPNAPSGVKKELTPIAELIYALGNNGGAAADYDSLRNTSTTASGTFTGFWTATTTSGNGVIASISFADPSVDAVTSTGISIKGAPAESFPHPTSTYATSSTISHDGSTVTTDTVNFATSGTFTGALNVGTAIGGVRIASGSTLRANVVNTQTTSSSTASFGLPLSYTGTIPTNATVTLTVTQSVNGRAYGTYTGSFQNMTFSNFGSYTGSNMRFNPPTEAQARSCNTALRAATSTEITSSNTLKHLVPAGYKLPDLGATSGNGGTTSTLSLCTYGQATANDNSPNTTFASILTSALGGNSTNAVTTCSETAKAAAVQFGEMVAK